MLHSPESLSQHKFLYLIIAQVIVSALVVALSLHEVKGSLKDAPEVIVLVPVSVVVVGDGAVQHAQGGAGCDSARGHSRCLGGRVVVFRRELCRQNGYIPGLNTILGSMIIIPTVIPESSELFGESSTLEYYYYTFDLT